MENTPENRAEVKAETVRLGRLVERIADGRIRVPPRSAGFSFNGHQAVSLLDSALRGFPIGVIVTWDTDAVSNPAGRIGPVRLGNDGAARGTYVLDGAQRVATLAGTLLPAVEDGLHATPENWEIDLDLEHASPEREAFVERQTTSEGPDAEHFPVRSLLYSDSFSAACRRLREHASCERQWRRWTETGQQAATRIWEYQVPLLHVQGTGAKDGLTIFRRLNSARNDARGAETAFPRA